MNFVSPQFLLLLVIPLALVLMVLLKAGKPVDMPVARDAPVAQPFTYFLMKAGQMIPALILAGFIVLLAQPVVDQQVSSRNPLRVTNIEILLNASRSMLATAEIGEHCRYCASKKAIGDFVSRRQGNTMGISIFGSRHLDLVPLTADLNCIAKSIARTYPDYIAYEISHSKDFAEGLRRSVEKLAAAEQAGAEKSGKRSLPQDSDRILILVTDGETRQLAGQEEELKALLAENNVVLYVATIADGNRSPSLARLAQSTPGGRLFECRDAKGFYGIMHHIDNMNKIVYKDQEPRKVNDTWLPNLVMGALLCCFAAYLTTPFRPMPW